MTRPSRKPNYEEKSLMTTRTRAKHTIERDYSDVPHFSPFLLIDRWRHSMCRFLFVHFFGSSMAGFFGLIFHIVDTSTHAFTNCVARIFCFLLVRFSRCAADHFLSIERNKCPRWSSHVRTYIDLVSYSISSILNSFHLFVNVWWE